MGKGQQNLLPARVVPPGPPIVLRHAYDRKEMQCVTTNF